jgi:hypothetical protein
VLEPRYTTDNYNCELGEEETINTEIVRPYYHGLKKKSIDFE